MTIPTNIFNTFYANRFSTRRYFCKPPLPSKNILYLDVSQPTIAEDLGYNMVSGDVVYVPDGFGGTDFGVSGLDVRELAAGTTNLDTGTLEDANYIFLPDTTYSTSLIDHSRDVKVFMGTARTGRNLSQQGGDIVHFLGGDSTLNFDADISTGARRSHVKGSNMKTALIYERVWLNNSGPTIYGHDGYKWGNTGDVQYTPDQYILDCGVENVYSLENNSVTISGGVIARTLKVLTVKTEGGASSDTLSTITGGTPGMELYLHVATPSPGDTVDTVILDTAGNIAISGGGTIDLTDTSLTAYLVYNGATSKWDASLSSENPRYGTLHADVAQPDGKFRFLFIDGLVGATYYQGLFFDPQSWSKASVIKNVNLKYVDPSFATNVHLYFAHFSSAAFNFYNDTWPDIWLDNIWCQKKAASSFENASVYPQTNSYGIPTTLSTDPQTGRGRVAFPAVTNIRGYVRESSPDLGYTPFGDIVNRGRQAGNTTFFRSYATRNEAFFDTSKCVLWLNVQDFYSMNNKAVGQEHITSVFDNSGQYNHVTCDTPVANVTFQKGKNGLYFNGNDYMTVGSPTLVSSTDSKSESLLASPTNTYTVYNVVGTGEGTFFSKGNQLRFYIRAGNVYGVCRGNVTLIHSGHSGVALIGAHWDGSVLTYTYNDADIVGSVGTDGENNLDIEWGRSILTDYFTGSWFDSRIEYDVFSSEYRTEYYDRMNDIWNIDGTQAYPDRPANPTGVTAALSGSNIRLTFTPSHTPGDEEFIGYYARLKKSTDENYTTYNFSAAVVSASPIDIPMTAFSQAGDHDFKVVARSLSGWSDMNSSETFTLNVSFEPTNSVAPSISGYEEEGEYLICVPGTWAGVPQPSFTYQWVRSGTPIVGATSSIYELQAADVGETLTCLVLGSNTEGSLEIETAATGVIGSATGGGFADIDDIAAVDIYMKTNDAGSITSSGGLVSAHANQVGGGTNAAQATSTLRPTTGTRTINSTNVFDFIPVDYLAIAENISSGTEFSFGLVFQMDNFSNERAIWDQSPGSTGVGLRTQSGGALFLFSYTDEGLIFLTDASTPLVAGTPYLVAGRFKSGFSQLWVNGGAPYATSTETFSSIVSASSDLIIGSRTEGSNVTDGVIGNYFFSTDTFLRNVEINNAMDKIATDFGLTWTPITL